MNYKDVIISEARELFLSEAIEYKNLLMILLNLLMLLYVHFCFFHFHAALRTLTFFGTFLVVVHRTRV